MANHTEERPIYGESRDTPNLHNVVYDPANKGCVKLSDGKWCFKKTELVVRTPGDSWVFHGLPWVECTRDNQGSWQWNAIPREPSEKFVITLNNPNEIRAYVLTNSHSVGVRLVCMARFYPDGA